MKIAGILFCLAALITSIGALVSGNISPSIQIAMMFICVGLMLTTIGRRN